MKKSAQLLALLIISTNSAANNYVVDARAQAMGGTGVAGASFLSSGFYNPALAAFNAPASNKTIAVTFPFFGARLNDPSNSIDNIKEFQDLLTKLENSPDPQTSKNGAQLLRKIQGSQSVVSGGLGGVSGIKGKNFSGVFFAKGYMQGTLLPEVSDSDINALENYSPTTTLNSQARMVSFGLFEIGVALARELPLLGQKFALGVTPKLQQIHTYHYAAPVATFDTDDWALKKNRSDEKAVNLDVGAAWQNGPLRVGVAAKNLFSKQIETVAHTHSYVYEMKPLYTLGVALSSSRGAVTADFDLNKQTHFSSHGAAQFDDDTQTMRVGAELSVTRWLQLRAGWVKDTLGRVDDMATLGFGLTPFGLLTIDVMAERIDKNSFGGALQLSFIY
ncbi:MAG: conjugal transfer protein TraF [Vibrionaceae bacterium]